MTSSISYRIITFWAAAVVAYTLFTGGLASTGINSILSLNFNGEIAILAGILASSIVAGIFLGAFIVAPILIFALNLFTKNANPFGSVIFSLAVGTPPALSTMILIIGGLVSVLTYLMVVWSFVDIIA